MATNTPSTPEEKQFLVLGDEEGTYYAIPLEIVEQHKATGEQRTQIEQALSGEDVEGSQSRIAISGPPNTDAILPWPIGTPTAQPKVTTARVLSLTMHPVHLR